MTDTTNTVRGTFESLAYGLFASMMDLENAIPSPMEKGDRGAVDKGNPGIKESDAYEKSAFRQCVLVKDVLFICGRGGYTMMIMSIGMF